MTESTYKILETNGFIEDKENLQLKEVLKNNSRFKELFIDIYPENPTKPSETFMLLLRTAEKNATVLNDGKRIILKKGDRYKTHILNILYSKIKECFFKLSDNCTEFIFRIQNIYYRLIVFN